MNMKMKEMLYEGKAKRVYATEDPKLCMIEYKDDATAFNGEKKGTIADKGIINNKMSNYFFAFLEKNGIPTHFVEQIDDRHTVVKKVQIVPLEVIVRNIAAGSFSKRYGVSEGTPLKISTLEFSYKNDDLGDPLINDMHAIALGLATEEEINTIKAMATRINDLMKNAWADLGVTLVDFKLEFGRFDGEILLADEISPDTCRFWDSKTGKKLDKDRFRFDLGGVEEGYQEIFSRLHLN